MYPFCIKQSNKKKPDFQIYKQLSETHLDQPHSERKLGNKNKTHETGDGGEDDDLKITESRAAPEAKARKMMTAAVDFCGWRLLAVSTAEKAEFW